MIFLEIKDDISQIFLEHECIFLRVNVTFYNAVNMIYDVIRTANSLLYSAKFMFVGARSNKTPQIRR